MKQTIQKSLPVVFYNDEIEWLDWWERFVDAQFGGRTRMPATKILIKFLMSRPDLQNEFTAYFKRERGTAERRGNNAA